jgi:CRP-like cAMP-binding protein
MVQRVARVEPLPLVVVRRGAVLVAQGEPCPAPLEVAGGVLTAEAVDRHGARVILDVLGPGDLAADGPADSPVTVRALRPSRLHPCPPQRVGQLRAERERRLTAFAIACAHHDLATRIDERLGDLAARFGSHVPGGVSIGFELTQTDLAAMTGAARESVNRALRRLIDQGRIAQPRRGRLVVRTPLRLVPP